MGPHNSKDNELQPLAQRTVTTGYILTTPVGIGMEIMQSVVSKASLGENLDHDGEPHSVNGGCGRGRVLVLILVVM